MNSRQKFILGTALCLVSVPTMAFAATSQVQVKKGDSLSKIAQENGSTVEALEIVNHLHTTVIQPGQILKIPVSHQNATSTSRVKLVTAAATTSSPKPANHKVTKAPVHRSGPLHKVKVVGGMTLWSVASEYGVSVKNLCAWNHISAGSVLHLGQLLDVYGGKTPSHTQANGSSHHESSRSETMSSSLSNGVFGEQVIAYARKFIGVPYAWGGESVHGFDCSGLVQFAFGHFGVGLPRDSYSQFNVGSSVSESNLMPGDLVFFDTDGGGASHVGIYVGGGTFINAAGSHVQIDSLYSSYWSGHYIGGRRVH